MSLKKKILGPVIIVAGASALFMLSNIALMWTLSTLDALIVAEGLWSKGQKNAIQHLYAYALSPEPKIFDAYLVDFAVMQGDQRARLELEKRAPDFGITDAALIAAGNHSREVRSIAYLFYYGRDLSFVREATQIWERGDLELEQLYRFADEVRARAQAAPGASVVGAIDMKKLASLNERLTVLENQFSGTVVEAARAVRAVLMWVHLFFVVIGFGSALFVLFIVIRRVLENVVRLRQGVLHFKQGDWSYRIETLESDDELTSLALAFNEMAEEIAQADTKRQKLRILLEKAEQMASLGTWSWTVATDTILWSRQMYAICGRDPQLPVVPFTELSRYYTLESWARLNEAVQRTLATGAPYELDLEMVREDGQRRFTITRGAMERDKAGADKELHGTVLDVTDRRIVQTQAQHQAEKFHTIFESSNDAIMLLSEAGFLDCNARTLQLFGLESKAQFIQKHPSELSPPLQPNGGDSMYEANAHIRRAFDKGLERFEWIHRRQDGLDFPAEVSLSSFDYEGKRALQAVVRDLTERKAAEQIMANQRAALLTTAKMSSLGEMAAGIAHEINNPLTVIVGNAARIKRQLDLNQFSAEDAEAALTKIENTGHRIAKIISGLRSFSRNADKDSVEPVLVSKVVEDTLGLCSERFKFHAVTLTCELGASAEALVLGRPAQLSQVLLNLLGNAYDAVELLPEKWVLVKGEVVGDRIILSVTDSGNGIDGDVAQKMMEPFFTTKDVGKGTGLGLSINKGIIEDHHGRFYYDESSAHTRFVIELPRA